MDQQAIITLTADIVAAHVSNNKVAVGEMGALVQRVHSAMAGLVGDNEPPKVKKDPVVSARASIKPDHLVCMECGKHQKVLKPHLRTAHGMTPAQYRQDYGLPPTYPMTAPNYSARRSELAKASSLGQKAKAAPTKKSAVRGRRQKAG